MVRGIKINCKRVYETGLKYNQEAEEIEKEQKQLTNIAEAIGEAWTGADSNNFLVSFNNHIKDLDRAVNFLNEQASILKGNALEHSNVDINFTNNMKRSDMNE